MLNNLTNATRAAANAAASERRAYRVTVTVDVCANSSELATLKAFMPYEYTATRTTKRTGADGTVSESVTRTRTNATAPASEFVVSATPVNKSVFEFATRRATDSNDVPWTAATAAQVQTASAAFLGKLSGMPAVVESARMTRTKNTGAEDSPLDRLVMRNTGAYAKQDAAIKLRRELAKVAEYATQITADIAAAAIAGDLAKVAELGAVSAELSAAVEAANAVLDSIC